jgi:hypothetical protein
MYRYSHFIHIRKVANLQRCETRTIERRRRHVYGSSSVNNDKIEETSNAQAHDRGDQTKQLQLLHYQPWIELGGLLVTLVIGVNLPVLR